MTGETVERLRSVLRYERALRDLYDLDEEVAILKEELRVLREKHRRVLGILSNPHGRSGGFGSAGRSDFAAAPSLASPPPAPHP